MFDNAEQPEIDVGTEASEQADAVTDQDGDDGDFHVEDEALAPEIDQIVAEPDFPGFPQPTETVPAGVRTQQGPNSLGGSPMDPLPGSTG